MSERDLIERLHDVYGSLTPGAIERADLDGMAFVIKDAIATIARLSEALAEAEKKGAEDKLRLDWIEANMNAELLQEGGWDDDDMRWSVFFVNGGRNDREWTRIGSGETVREAIDAAIRAAPPRDLSQGGQHG